MPTEIEHKYLVIPERWAPLQMQSAKRVQVSQGYLLTDPDKTIRIRTLDNQGYVTIKGRTIGARRAEYEYEIPIDEANELIHLFCSETISKTRHFIDFGAHTWEVDVFHGLNQGLVIAEIELESEQEIYEKPDWLGLEITHDPRYANSNLTVHPFSLW